MSDKCEPPTQEKPSSRPDSIHVYALMHEAAGITVERRYTHYPDYPVFRITVDGVVTDDEVEYLDDLVLALLDIHASKLRSVTRVSAST